LRSSIPFINHLRQNPNGSLPSTPEESIIDDLDEDSDKSSSDSVLNLSSENTIEQAYFRTL
jgi:hypothetical protein